MRTFRFAIESSNPFIGDVQLPSDDAAWEDGLGLVRDIEGLLRPGENWTLTVSDDREPVFRITVETFDLREARK